jgi:endonuclease YncB( thermonuclease family)
MQFLLILILASVTTAETPEPGPGAEPRSRKLQRSESLLVRAVPSGDAVDVATIGRVHLLGITAPGTRTGPGTASIGIRARDRLADLVLRHWVRLEYETGSSRGSGGAYLWREDGVFVNAVLVRDGLARVTVRRPLARLDELQRAEQEARAARRGIWSDAP